MTLSYAEEREANIRRNRLVLCDLKYKRLVPDKEPKEQPRVKSKRRATETEEHVEAPPRKTVRAEVLLDIPSDGKRRSNRLANHAPISDVRRGTPLPLTVKKIVSSSLGDTKNTRKHNPKVYGNIPGIEVGSWWATREECSNDSVHAPWVGGIAPGQDGAYSVALSGGYEDDVDDGYAFTYTGAGGRDLKGTKAAPKNLRTAEQSFDQSFEHNHNKALKRSAETGKPVRVIRGFKLQSRYGPSEGYRYDGLYEVKRYWTEKGLGKGGHLVCKYAFIRLEGQPDIPVNPAKIGDADDIGE
ncbi:PUA-like domain-containing protein [Scleroderma yunnanense]